MMIRKRTHTGRIRQNVYRSAIGSMRVPDALRYKPTHRTYSKVGGRVKKSIPRAVKMSYKIKQSIPSFVQRANSYRVQAQAGEQALVTYMSAKLNSLLNVNRNTWYQNPPTEIGLDRFAGGVNCNQYDSLPWFNETAAAGSAWSISRPAVPSHAWTLMDNWNFRDMLLYCTRLYSNENQTKLGYLPPTKFNSNGLYSNNGLYYGYNSGTTGTISLPLGAKAEWNVVSGTPTNLVGISTSDIGVITNDGTTASTEHSVGFHGSRLFVHGQGIEFNITNMEDNIVHATMYEFILRDDLEFLSDGSNRPTGSTATTTHYGAGCGLPDPVELWQTAQLYGGNDFRAGAVEASLIAQADSGTSQSTRRSVYEIGMDPLTYLNKWYIVKRKTVTIEPGATRKLNYYVKFNSYVPARWWDTLYAFKGVTRTYMLRAHGVRALAVGGTGIANASNILGQTSTDANIRVDVVKSFRASLSPIRKKTSFIERIPRIAPNLVVDTIEVEADGDINTTSANEIGGFSTGTTLKKNFAENLDALA